MNVLKASDIARPELVLERLVQCYSIITELQAQLVSRDEQLKAKDVTIAALEEKIVAMSLELASTKASEDKLRSAKRRASLVSDNESIGSQLAVDKKEGHQTKRQPRSRRPQGRRASTMDISRPALRTAASSKTRRAQSWFNASDDDDDDERDASKPPQHKLLESFGTSSQHQLDDSSTSKVAEAIGQIFSRLKSQEVNKDANDDDISIDVQQVMMNDVADRDTARGYKILQSRQQNSASSFGGVIEW